MLLGAKFFSYVAWDVLHLGTNNKDTVQKKIIEPLDGFKYLRKTNDSLYKMKKDSSNGSNSR